MSNNHICTSVELSELLFQFILRTWRFHQADTMEVRREALANWQELSKRLWGNYSNRAAAHAGLANPQLAWLVQKNLRMPENVAVIENAVAFIVNLAARRPCTHPAICRDKRTATSKWDQQEERLLAADNALNALNRLLALAGIVSPNNGRVPWRDLPEPGPSPSSSGDGKAQDATTSPSKPQPSSSDRASETASLPESQKQDGTLTEDNRIWLNNRKFGFTPKLRALLSYLLLNPNCHEDEVISHCGFTGSSHLHKRLKDLRNREKTELKKENFTLTIKTEARQISCTLRMKEHLQTTYRM